MFSAEETKEIELQTRCDSIVRREVFVCLSSLVSTLRGGDIQPLYKASHELAELATQAAELSMPISDYQEAAEQAGWSRDDGGHRAFLNSRTGDEDLDATSWEELFNDPEWQAQFDWEPYEWEVYEHWAVSEWLADALIELGEKVDKDFAGMCVWARTTTGQSISMDSVIRQLPALIDKRVTAFYSKPA